MAIKVQKNIVDLETELNAELSTMGFQIIYNPNTEKIEDKKDKETKDKKNKTTSKKK